jgi:hypothetical protein
VNKAERLSREWLAAEQAHDEATARRRTAMAAALPVGRYVAWEHGRHVRSGTIDMVSFYGCGGRVRVVSATSGKSSWIHVARIEAYIRECQ